MKRNREKDLAINSVIIGMGMFLPKIAALVTLPIVTGNLSKIEYGYYDLIVVLISLVLPLLTLQIQGAAFRFLVDKRSDNQESSAIVTNILFFVFAISVPVVIAGYFFIHMFPTETRIVICLYFLADIILQNVQSICRGLGNNKVYSISCVLNAFINMALVVLFISVLKFKLDGVLLSLLLANVITTLIVFVWLRLWHLIKISEIRFAVIKEMISYSWPFIPNNLSSWVMTLSDRILLALFLGVEVNAVYAVSKKIPNLLTSVQSTFSLAWLENASLADSDDDKDQYFSKMFDVVFNIVLGACALLIGMSRILFNILIKGDYKDAYYQMPVLFLGMFFMTLSSYLAGIYVADKRTMEIGVTTTIAAIINLVIDLIFIPFIGMWAASISTLISYAFLFIYRIIDLNKYHHISYKKKRLILLIGLIILLCIISELNIFVLDCITTIIGFALCLKLNWTLVKHIIKSKD